jgi:hypothetical protein
MKKLFLIALLLPLFAKAQDTTAMPKLPVDSITHLVTYQQIANTPGINKADLYSKAREWFAVSFKAANNVLHMDDKENGKLIGRGSFSDIYNMTVNGMTVPVQYIIEFTINVTVKDFKYRIILSDFEFKDSASSLPTPIETYYSNMGMFKEKLPAKFQKAAMEMQAHVLAFINSNGNGTLESFNNGIMKAKRDDF